MKSQSKQPLRAHGPSMRIEVISTGAELLRGTRVNTNLAVIGRTIAAAGLTVRRAQTVDDDRGSLISAFHQAAMSGDVIISTGGLGSTADDLTRDVAAEFFGTPLVRSAGLADELRRAHRRRHPGLPVPASLLRQADVPDGAEILPNGVGSAPGLHLSASYAGHACHVFLLPGPPAEMEPMLTAEVLPRLASLNAGGGRIFTRGFFVVGGGELQIEEKLAPLSAAGGTSLAYCAEAGGVRVFLSAPDASLLDRDFREAYGMFAGSVLPEGCFSVAEALIAALKDGGLTLGLAESCTGGLVSAAVTAVPGASAVFRGGVAAYDNRVKKDVLGVPDEILAGDGAVSAGCALAMSRGVRRLLRTDCAAAVTGIAGPGGGTDLKPVGLVYAAASCGGSEEVREYRFSGGRDAVRRRSCAAALRMLYGLVSDR